MAQSTPLFVGLDVHKDSIAVAHAAGGGTEPPVYVGAIGTRRPTWIGSSTACRAKRPRSASRTKPGRAATVSIGS